MTEKELAWHNTYLNIAESIASHSHANKAKVGAVIVKNQSIISFGYNGTPSGFNNVCEVNNATKVEVIHAEINAIAKCAKHGLSTSGATMYITLPPCVECAKLIIQAGIKEVFFKCSWKTDGILLLSIAGISCSQILNHAEL